MLGLDVVGCFARFLEAVLPAEGFTPGIAMNRAGQGVSGDARTIAGLARTRDLRPILPDDDTLVALRLEVGRRREPIQDRTRRISRLRGRLCGILPGLERTLDLTRKGPLAPLARHVTPGEIRRAGTSRLRAPPSSTQRLHGTGALVDRALEAARAQTIVVPGEGLTALEARQTTGRIDHDPEALPAEHPDGAVVRSPPERGEALAAGITACVGDKAIERVLHQSAFRAGATGDPFPRAFHDRERREGKRHTEALVDPARRRVTAIRTMLQRREAFDPHRKAA